MSLRLNFLANFLGSGAVVLIHLAVMPLYLTYLGAEAFGLIGLFATLTVVSSVLDLGLSPAISKELAQLSANAADQAKIRSTVRSFEVVFCVLAVLLLCLAYPLLPFLATNWLRIQMLDIQIVEQALRLMSVQLALQLPLALYAGSFVGLQKQVHFNVLTTVMVFVRMVGALVVMVWGDTSIITFFRWQLLLTGCHLAVVGLFLWRVLPPGRTWFDLAKLKKLSKFASEMAGVALLSLLLTQLDKIILSRMLPLSEFGYYMLAWSLASVLLRFATPVFTAWLPRMSQLVQTGDRQALKETYFSGFKLVAAMVLPIAGIISIFARQILEMYTQNLELARVTTPALVMLVIGMACNALMHMPYGLTLAHGWAKFALLQNTIACICIVPLIYFSVKTLGLQGAALGWCVVNVAYVLFSIRFIQRRYFHLQD